MATNFYSSTHLFCTALQDSAGSRGASGSGLVGARQASSELTDRLAITRGDILAMQKRVEGGAEYSRIESRIETAGEGREGLSARGEGAGGKQEPSMISRGFVRPRSGRRLVSAGKSRPESARPLSGRGPIRPDTRGILKSQVLSRPPSLPFSLYLSLSFLSLSLCVSLSPSPSVSISLPPSRADLSSLRRRCGTSGSTNMSKASRVSATYSSATRAEAPSSLTMVTGLTKMMGAACLKIR